MNPSDYDELLTQDEAARFLRCAPRTLEGKRVAGDGPRFVRLSPRMIRYRRSDLESYVAKNVRGSTSEYFDDPGPEDDD